MPAFGCASAGAIVVGQAIGAGAKDLVSGIVRRTAILLCVYQGLVGLCYFAAPGAVMAVFGGEKDASADVIQLATKLLPLSAAWQLFDALAMTLSEALRAAGDTLWMLWARIILAWAFFVPISQFWIHPGAGGSTAAMLSIVIYIAVLAVVFFLRFRSGAWRKIQLVGDAPPM